MMSVWGILLLYFPSAKLLLCFHKSSWKPNATVACFTHVFPYLATVSCFPALDSRFTISRAWQPLHDFPRLTSFVYFDMEFWLAHYVVCLAMIGQPTVVGKPLYWYISTFLCDLFGVTGLGKLSKLAWLSLAGNNLTTLDTGVLEKLPQLRFLSVENNAITYLRGLQVS